jgi:hypothetical protein
MSEQDKDQPLFRNEDTLRRRAWIDRALAGVRQRLKPSEHGEQPVSTAGAEDSGPGDDPAGNATPGRPRLYVVRGHEPR